MGKLGKDVRTQWRRGEGGRCGDGYARRWWQCKGSGNHTRAAAAT